MIILKVAGVLVLLGASLALFVYSTVRYWMAHGGLSLSRKCNIVRQDVDGMMLHFVLGALGLGGLCLGMRILFDVVGEIF